MALFLRVPPPHFTGRVLAGQWPVVFSACLPQQGTSAPRARESRRSGRLGQSLHLHLVPGARREPPPALLSWVQPLQHGAGRWLEMPPAAPRTPALGPAPTGSGAVISLSWLGQAGHSSGATDSLFLPRFS